MNRGHLLTFPVLSTLSLQTGEIVCYTPTTLESGMQSTAQLSFFLLLFSGIDSLRSFCLCRLPARSPRNLGWMGALKASVEDTRPGEADHKGSGIPNELRDIIVEKIEEIGGGKVKEVSRTRQL